MKHWGIRARVLFVALVPSVLILFALVTYFTHARIAEVDVALAQHGLSVARQLAPGVEFALFAGDRAALQRMADAAAREAGVASIEITDARGQVLSRSRRIAGDEPLEVIQFTHPVRETRLAVDIPEQLRASAGPAVVGEITVAMSRSAAHDEQRRLLMIGLVLGLACMAAAVLLATVIGDSVIRPIRALADAMTGLGRGPSAPPLAVSEGGELRTLQEGFNEMSARLQDGTRELQARIDAATRALSAQRDTAEQATNAKSRFIAAASHDLRQPLHAIGLFTGALERRTTGTELEGVVGDLAQAVAAMDRLFDSLLDISKLDAGSLRAEPKAFRLARLFAQLEAEHLDSAAQKGIVLRVRPTSAVIVSDELLLQRLLSNLVANAIRYTSVGTVLVCARRRADALQIEVRDSGIGIAPDKQDEIFCEFYQIGNAARDRNLGLGLGLAIVARIARLLGSEVLVRSEPGRGSVFFLRVPLGRLADDEVQDRRTVASAPGAPSTTLQVLVVDDDELVLAGQRALLAEWGCRVTAVSTTHGAEAALAGLGSQPVLVFCDLWLSDQRSGIDLLRNLAVRTDAPISGILVSGDTRPETMQLAKASGYLLIHKPVSPAKLRAIVQHFSARLVGPRERESGDEDTDRR
jgi:signal transduction histidine kinase/FixJ family two-component response regulator